MRGTRVRFLFFRLNRIKLEKNAFVEKTMLEYFS